MAGAGHPSASCFAAEYKDVDAYLRRRPYTSPARGRGRREAPGEGVCHAPRTLSRVASLRDLSHCVGEVYDDSRLVAANGRTVFDVCAYPRVAAFTGCFPFVPTLYSKVHGAVRDVFLICRGLRLGGHVQ
jgi:hypothetical protein